MADGEFGLAPVFVSHAGPDTGWAEWVAWQLRVAGHEVELAVWDWQAGESFVARMRAAMQKRGLVMVALFSQAYFDPGRFSMAEWDAARAAAQAGALRIVPVRVEAMTPPIFDGPLIFVDLFGLDPAMARRRVLEAVRGRERPLVEPEFPGPAAASTVGPEPRLPSVLPRVWKVPPRNRLFTGRDEMLARLRVSLSREGRAVLQALQGMGGVGKTSLANEYAHRFAGDFGAVWWIDAEQPALIPEQFRALAVAVGVADADADADVAAGAEAAWGWLRGERGWLVVLDNAEDPEEVQRFLPEGAGQVLVTSRDPKWGRLAPVASVDVFARAESVGLLRTRFPGIGDGDADAVAAALGDLPLGLAQAAAFMSETGTSPGEYVGLLGDRVEELMSRGTPLDYPRSLAAATNVVMLRLEVEDAAAAELAAVAAWLAPEPIRIAWFTTAAHEVTDAGDGRLPEPLVIAARSPVAFSESVGRLVRYGLARSTASGFVIHRLTAAVLRGRLTPQGQAACRAGAETVVVSVAPVGDGGPETWPTWVAVMPHLIALDPANSDNPAVRHAGWDGAWELTISGNLVAGAELARRLYTAWRGRLGPDHPDTQEAANTLATALRSLGDYRGARELDEDTLARRRQALGEDHPNTLNSAGSLANDLHALGEVAAARELDEDTLARSRRVLGEDHLHTLSLASNLAIDLHMSGEVAAARDLHEDTLARKRRVLGEDHPNTLNSANNLAATLRELGDREAARELDEDTLARRRRVLGEDHPETLKSADNLALDLRELGDREAARELDEDTLARRRRVLGEDHPDTLTLANDLARDLRALEQVTRTGRAPRRWWRRRRRSGT